MAEPRGRRQPATAPLRHCRACSTCERRSQVPGRFPGQVQPGPSLQLERQAVLAHPLALLCLRHSKLPTTDSARALHQHLTSNAFDHSTAGNRRFPGRSRAPSFHYGPAVDDPLDGHLRPDCVHRRDFRCMYRSSCYRG
ncbi:uncharacterized protein LOC112890764 isoform X2 [Panicum hallii]|uniref:uncharacterized protein LOC112890764 isoform X2 n=1 Tax=Panicum hallii TaxID=206008 RepID=UPI000DF4EDC2|nr:uncharacterized protein LOC112890764 isoform X2 [Panicum hallii]